jgi:triacylglycerol esterase/lipase EstA (alpha/beta hydrolase family)
VRPVVIVHGIWDDARSIAPLVRGLRDQGIATLSAVELDPPWGTVGIETLAAQLAQFVERARALHGADAVDIVGFSMGALVARTYLQLLGGDTHVHSFVSISGPHRGTWTAYALPLLGVRQMRPGSPLLRALGDDVSHLSNVAVHCLYTPYDAMIVPSESGVLRGARSVHSVPVALHRLMIHDRRVHTLVAGLLAQHTPDRPARRAGAP